MSSTDPTKVDSLIMSATMRRTSLRPFRLQQLLNTKSLSLMRQTIRPTTYNSVFGHLLRNLLVTVGSFSHVTTKIKSLNPCTRDVPLSSLESKEKTDSPLPPSSSNVSNKSWMQKVLNMITRSW